MHPSATVSVYRATVNAGNAQRSTGPRTAAGKRRSSRNAIRHGLTARTAVIPAEHQDDYDAHCRKFRDEYQPANSTESQLVQELADTSWRLNRIPLLEADVLTAATSPDCKDNPRSAIEQIAVLGLYSSRLSRQFQKTLDLLRNIQDQRREREKRDLRDAANLLEFHKQQDLPWQPSDHGFVFSKDQVERHSERLMRLNEARRIGYFRFDVSPQDSRALFAATAL